jgi:hypothetical protein
MEDGAQQMGTALAFYTVSSLAPVLIDHSGGGSGVWEKSRGG